MNPEGKKMKKTTGFIIGENAKRIYNCDSMIKLLNNIMLEKCSEN